VLRILARAALLALGAFAGGELAVRILADVPLAERLPIMSAQANEFRGWAMVPGEAHYTYQHKVQLNSHGFRSREIEPKQEGELRVLALGDSLLYGQGVATEDTITAEMETLLRERMPGRPVNVINAGHRAYDTRQELGLVRELGAELDPDVVIVFWFWNDLHERPIEKTYDALQRIGTIAFDVGAPMEGWVEAKWRATQLVRSSALVMYLYDWWRATSHSGEMAPDYVDAGMERFEFYLSQFQRLSGELGFRLVYAIIPEPAGLMAPHHTHAVDARAAELLAAAGVETIQFQAALSALAHETGRLPVIPYDGHYLPEGNRVMAEAVVEALAP